MPDVSYTKFAWFNLSNILQIAPVLSKALSAEFLKTNQQYAANLEKQLKPQGRADVPVITISSSEDDADGFHSGNEGDQFNLAASSCATSDSEIDTEAT